MNIFSQPFSWAPGTAKPIVNDFSWTNLSSVLFVEQPVGTGYSVGKPNITVSLPTEGVIQGKRLIELILE